jgi:hypothetical protein
MMRNSVSAWAIEYRMIFKGRIYGIIFANAIGN